MPGETGATWDDYRGNPEIVENAKRIVTLLRGVKEFKEMGGEAIRGFLLCGPTGTGKSYLAKVIANEAKVPFAYASAPSFQNMFFGVGNLKVMAFTRKHESLRKYTARVLFLSTRSTPSVWRNRPAVEAAGCSIWAAPVCSMSCSCRWIRRLPGYEWGLKQPLRSMSQDEKQNVACHEAGHAVAQYLLKPHERVWKVTIIRRGGALGLAARAVEEEFLGKKLNGVTSDLQQATELAGVYLGMVGMGDELFSWLASGPRTDALKALRPKINELLKDQMLQVKKLVNEHSDFVHAIADELLKRGDLTGEEIELI